MPRGVRTKYDAIREQWVLLAPERAIKLDPVGIAILNHVDGKTTFENIVKTLAAKFGAPTSRVAEDSEKFLSGLIDRRMIELQE